MKLYVRHFHTHKTYPEIRSLIGTSVTIPCNVTISSPSDAVTLILWYRGDDISGSPIYSIDARTVPIVKAKHFINETFEYRAKFDISLSMALLHIDPVIDTDDGQYWCRVDFRWTRTIISSVKLSVIVPISDIIISFGNNETEIMDNSTIYANEGQKLNISCKSFGGKPSPVIIWMLNDTLIDDTYEYINKSSVQWSNVIVLNQLFVSQITRDYHWAQLQCKTFNSNLTLPLQKSISLDINLMPLTVEILPFDSPLSSGRESIAICLSRGSKPAAHLTWTFNGRDATHLSESFINEDFSRSVLKITPYNNDNGSLIICRATNSQFQSGGTIETRMTINVYFPPIMTLSSAANVIVEENEMILHCIISANPMPSLESIQWFHNGNSIVENDGRGIITRVISSNSSSLIIKNVNHEYSGDYQCHSINSEGIGKSNSIHIDVHYVPRCKWSTVKWIRTKPFTKIPLKCDVTAFPMQQLSYQWSVNGKVIDLNSDANKVMLKSDMSMTINESVAYVVLRPKPKSHRNATSVITCWAVNHIGSQRVPCTFNVISIGDGKGFNSLCTNITASELINNDCVNTAEVTLNRSVRTKNKSSNQMINNYERNYFIVICIFSALIMIIVIILGIKLFVILRPKVNSKGFNDNSLKHIRNDSKCVIETNDSDFLLKVNDISGFNLSITGLMSDTDRSSSIKSSTTLETIATIEAHPFNSIRGSYSTVV